MMKQAQQPDASNDQDEPIPVTVERVARLFDVTEKTVRSWIRNGMPAIKSGSKGKGNGAILDLAVVINWYLQENALDIAKTRLASAQADKHEMENAERRGELLRVSTVAREWESLIVPHRAQLLGMPKKLAPQLAGMNNAIAVNDLLTEEVHRILDIWARYKPQHGSNGDLDVDREDAAYEETAAAINGEPVGRRKAKVKSGKQRGTRTMAH